MANVKIGKWKVERKDLDREIDTAIQRGEQELATEHRAKTARYDSRSKRIVIDLINGCTFIFPADLAQGLQGASAKDLSQIKILGPGTGLSWPSLDADFSVDGLVKGIFGTKAWMASEMGRKGGRAKSEAKVAASRANGSKGGRPKKRTIA